MKPLISVIVTVYNLKDYLGKCIDSISTQTISDIEIVLVDDGSTDGSGGLCDKYAMNDHRINVVHKKNGGLLRARQTGVMAAKADWVGFVDGDDWIEDHMYKSLYAAAVDNRADIVIQGYAEDIEGMAVPRINHIKEGKYIHKEARLSLYGKMMNCVEYFGMGIQPYVWNKLYRKSFLSKHLMEVDPNIKIGEDAAILFPLLLEMDRIVVTEDCCYHYCLRKSSMMHKREDDRTEYANIKMLHHFLKEQFLQKGFYDIMRDSLDRYAVNNVLTRAMGIVIKEIPALGRKNIVVYGAGALGKALYEHIICHDFCHLKAWVDQDAERKRLIGYPVCRMDEIKIAADDSFVIAIFNRETASAVRLELEKSGVGQKQIVWLLDCIDIDHVKSTIENSGK